MRLAVNFEVVVGDTFVVEVLTVGVESKFGH